MKRMIIAMTLILALVLGAVALAETTEPEAPAGQSEQAVPEEGAATEDGAEPKDENADAAAAPEDAFKALRDARLSTKLEELQAELDEYVAAGKLTQEQADLIMDNVKERQESRQNKGRRDCQQVPGNQQDGNQMPQMPGNQQDSNQVPQMPGNQQGGSQMPQMPGNQQDGSQVPQMPGNRQQVPGMQGGNRQSGQFPGRG